jgi:hemerythrin-like domain-containing protein
MPMSDLCRSLEEEHKVIRLVLDALEHEARAITSGGAVNTTFFAAAIAFVREYADGVHHQKEEVILFPRMERAGMPRDGGPIGCMLSEHDEGRGCIKQIDGVLQTAAAGDDAAREFLVAATENYVGILRAHTEKEDGVLFVLADELFDDAQKAAIRSEFAAAEETDAAVITQQRAWAEALSIPSSTQE